MPVSLEKASNFVQPEESRKEATIVIVNSAQLHMMSLFSHIPIQNTFAAISCSPQWLHSMLFGN
jgi:hypothetical protein